MDWSQVYQAHRPYRRRVLGWQVLGTACVLVGLGLLAVALFSNAATGLRAVAGAFGLALGGGAGWMFRRAFQIGNSPLLVVRGSITELTPGDYDLPSSVILSVASAFQFGQDGVTTPMPNRLGTQRLSIADYAVFKSLGEGQVNVRDAQFLCLSNGEVISLLNEALDNALRRA